MNRGPFVYYYVIAVCAKRTHLGAVQRKSRLKWCIYLISMTTPPPSLMHTMLPSGSINSLSNYGK